jgi:steroid delta-isomerase-like uncharacterized protein
MNVPDHIQATIEHFNVLFNQQDLDAVMALMTEDVVFENTSGGRFEGADHVRALLQRAFALMTPGGFDTEELIVADDRVVVLWTYHFNRAEQGRGRIRGVDVFRLRAGKVAEKLSYVKSAEFVQKLGLTISDT